MELPGDIPCTLYIPEKLKTVMKQYGVKIFKDKLFCEKCQVTMNNDGAVESHLNKHFVEMQQTQRSKKLYVPGKFKTVIKQYGVKVFEDKLFCERCQVTMNNDGAVKSHLNKHFVEMQQTQRSKKLHVPEKFKTVIKQYGVKIFKDKLFCDKCEVVMENNGAVEGHLNKHFVEMQQSERSNWLHVLEKFNTVIKQYGVKVFEDKLFCERCQVTMNNDSAVESHLNKHLREMQQSDDASKKVQKIVTNCKGQDIARLLCNDEDLRLVIKRDKITVFEDRLYCKKCDVFMTNESAVKSHLGRHVRLMNADGITNLEKLKNLENENSVARMAEPPESKPHFDKADLAFHYSVCEVKIEEEDAAIENFESETHQKNTLQAFRYKCSCCDVSFSERKSLEEHFNGLKHTKYANIIQFLRNEYSSIFKDNTEKSLKKLKMKLQKKQLVSNFYAVQCKNYLKYETDYIYDPDIETASKIETSVRLTLFSDSANCTCLVCLMPVSSDFQEYYVHLNSSRHYTSLNEMLKDNELFKGYPDQYSDLNLAYDFMVTKALGKVIDCLVCGVAIEDDDSTIKSHIDSKTHATKVSAARRKSEELSLKVSSMLRDNWYNVMEYWCAFCGISYSKDIMFVEHLRKDHDGARFLDGSKIHSCVPCAIMWYGPNHHSHCLDAMHKYMTRSKDYMKRNMPENAGKLLKDFERAAADLITQSDLVSSRERKKEIELLKCLEETIKPEFPTATAYPFGSRVSGLGFVSSDVDVFLDCENRYKKQSTQFAANNVMKTVLSCLKREQKTWDIEEVVTNSRTQIIKMHHRATEIQCDISFTNGLSVENTKLLKCYNDAYPDCRKLILFLKKWLSCCDLSGSHYITSYALAWLVVFYLQRRSILPSVASLIQRKNESKMIDHWETGVTHEFHFDPPDVAFVELLTGFLEFYANFDYRYQVVCPLIGDVVAKKSFLRITNLPKAMAPYVRYHKSASSAEIFRIDSAMCVQDPFDLSHNLTKAVKKFAMNRFRHFCDEGAKMLASARC